MPAFRRQGLAKSRALVAALEEIAGAHGATASQAALAWLLQVPGGAVVVIPGATSVAQAEENARAQHLRLSDDEVARLDALSRPFR
jgi:aryl-alcohol dehydrogenase-like predicted oxidoreductase